MVVPPPFEAIDQSTNARPDWGTCWLIRDFIKSRSLDNEALYGFFPESFSRQTGLAINEIFDFAATAAKEGSQIVLFDLKPEISSTVKNTFEHENHSDPRFLGIAQELLNSLKIPLTLDRLFMDSRHMVWQYCLFATPAFWRTWLAIIEQLVAVSEGSDSALRSAINQAPHGTTNFARKTIFAEKFVSLILAGQRHWRVKTYGPFSLQEFQKLPRYVKQHAVACDALKRVINDQGGAAYIETFESMVTNPPISPPKLPNPAGYVGEQLLSSAPSTHHLGLTTERLPSAASLKSPSIYKDRDGESRLLPSKDWISHLKRCERLLTQGDLRGAIEQYQLWLSIPANEMNHLAWFNLSNLLGKAGHYEQAAIASTRAIALKPDMVGAYLNRFLAVEKMGKPQEAVVSLIEAIKSPELQNLRDRAQLTTLLNQLGRLQDDLRDFKGAEVSLKESLMINSNQPDAISTLVRLRQKQCSWPVLSPFGAVTESMMQRAASPLFTLGFLDDPDEQLQAAIRKVKELIPKRPKRLTRSDFRHKHERVRLAYVSGDLRTHAVGLLTVELLELHDRDRFEVYAYCWSRNEPSELQRRIRSALDHFVPIGNMTDREAAMRIAADEIDIVIDLQGLTLGARPNIIAAGAAPIQISFLGFPGTCAIPHVDYIVADEFVFPASLDHAFTEKALRLPICFQPSDRKRAVGIQPRRSDHLLPQDAFVFCALNNNYKITDTTFRSWMRVLKACPGSILWLLADNDLSRTNLINEAVGAGVDPDRLVFALRVSPPDYLARFELADVFLDTYPYNAGTTANDALWMGVPILTVSGKSYISRMAGSLLRSVGLESFICDSQSQQEEKAIAIYHQRYLIEDAKARLMMLKVKGELFDTTKYTRTFEEALLGLQNMITKH